MPLQNRVTPFGEIIATPARGLFIGNRGIIHDPETRTLTTKRWTLKAWLICRCDYKGTRREVMARRSWTELFFLDEATALAAGHRPCFLCRRPQAEAFRAAWVTGNHWVAGNHVAPPRADNLALPRAGEIDAVLHAERLRGREKRLHPLPAPARDLPTGAMLAAGGESYLVTDGRLRQWSVDGYHMPASSAATALRFDGLLTPPSTLRALGAGYRPVLHASALAAAI